MKPLTIPGEATVIDPTAAERLCGRTLAVAKDLGFDKVSAGVVLLDLAILLMRENRPPVRPELIREVLERAVATHYGRAT